MRPKSRRLTVSNLMIAIVAFALSIKLGLYYSRSAKYWDEARFYERAGDNARFLAKILESEEIPFQVPQQVVITPPTAGIAPKGVVTVQSDPRFELHGAERREAALKSRRFAERLDQMRAKYRLAAFLPWLPNAPDVP